MSQVSVRITGHVTKGCRLSYQRFILVSLSLCFLLIKAMDNKGTVGMPAVIKAVNNSQHLNNSNAWLKKKKHFRGKVHGARRID